MPLNRFSRDRRGSVAVEFALIAPLMILFYSGTAEIAQALMAKRSQSHVAAVIGDLVAQSSQVTAADVDDIFNIGFEIIAPFPTSDLSMRVTVVRADPTGAPIVQWSRIKGSALPKLSGPYKELPAGYPFVAGDSVVIAETTYSYHSQFGQVLKDGLNLKDKILNVPRKVQVICADCT